MKDKIFLNKTLFWDVDYKNIDKEKNASFIVERVLNYGDEKDYKELKRVYGLLKIKKIAKEINYINKKNINFWSIMFDIPLKHFKCTKKFLDKKQNLFLAR